MKNKNKQLKNYYSSYYDNNYYRDIRLLGDRQLVGYDKEKDKPKYFTPIKTFKVATGTDLEQNLKNSRKFKNFIITNRKGLGTLASEITHFRNFTDWSDHNNRLRYTDRLFLDLDTDHPKAKELKKQQLEASKTIKDKKERAKVIAESKAEFKELVLNEHILRDTYREVNILVNYLQDKLELKPYLIFSGSKGFHINIFFNRLQINNINKITDDLTKSFKNNLNLKTIDLAVTDGKTRLQRVPYSIHERTGLTTIPIPVGLSYTELLEEIDIKPYKVEPVELDLNTYYTGKAFTETLVRLDNKITLLKSEAERVKAKELERKRPKTLTIAGKYSSNYNSKEKPFKDLRPLVRHILGEPEYVTKDGNIMYMCVFHTGASVDVIVGKDVYYCFGCKVAYNYWSFIKNYYKCKDNKEVWQHINRLKEEMAV